MKTNKKKSPPRKRLLYAKLFSTIVLALLLAYTIFIHHPDAEAVTPFQLLLSLTFILVEIDYRIYKLRYDIFGDIGGQIGD